MERHTEPKALRQITGLICLRLASATQQREARSALPEDSVLPGTEF